MFIKLKDNKLIKFKNRRHIVKIYEIDPYFYEHYKKIQVNENGCEYELFRIDVYFSEYLLAVENDKKGHTDRGLIFEEKSQEALEINLGCKFSRINTSKKGNKNYEAGRIETFISKFKNRQLRELKKEPNKKVKELEDEIKRFKL